MGFSIMSYRLVINPPPSATQAGKRKLIGRVQERLNRLGASLLLTGSMDNPTRRVLATFQKEQGLKVTRRLDGSTLEALGFAVKEKMPEPYFPQGA